MSFDGPPGEPPEVRVEIDEDLETVRSSQGFLQLHCRSLRRLYADGTHSDSFRYDVVERRCLDAVVIVLHRQGPGRQVEVCLRSQLRVPLLFRQGLEVPDADLPTCPVLWELPAGLIESGESGDEGIARRASAETLEEAGYELDPSRFASLGHAGFPAPGVLAEKLHFVHARLLEGDEARPPAGDGHPLEEDAQLCFVPLGQALRAADHGQLLDLKTELGLRRLASVLRGAP